MMSDLEETLNSALKRSVEVVPCSECEAKDKRIAELEALIKDNLEEADCFETEWNREARRLLKMSKEDTWEPRQ